MKCSEVVSIRAGMKAVQFSEFADAMSAGKFSRALELIPPEIDPESAILWLRRAGPYLDAGIDGQIVGKICRAVRTKRVNRRAYFSDRRDVATRLL